LRQAKKFPDATVPLAEVPACVGTLDLLGLGQPPPRLSQPTVQRPDCPLPVSRLESTPEVVADWWFTSIANVMCVSYPVSRHCAIHTQFRAQEHLGELRIARRGAGDGAGGTPHNLGCHASAGAVGDQGDDLGPFVLIEPPAAPPSLGSGLLAASSSDGRV
jgi:hypothetical protein